MKTRKLRSAALVGALLLGAACAAGPNGDRDRPADEPPAAEADSQSQRAGELSREQRMAKRRELSGKQFERVPVQAPGSGRDEVPEEVLARIVADLKDKIGAEASAIQVVIAAATVWNDGALGCPEPGAVYTPATIRGYRVILNHQGQRYDYRADERGRFMLCEQPTLQPPPQRGETTAKD